jgi:hypothetical protein
MRLLLPLAVLAVTAAPLPAAACSVAPGYRVPTNIELVEQADVILLGLVEDGDFEPDSTGQTMIQVQPVEALKGEFPTAPIALPATIATDTELVLSNPYELQNAHPQSLAGACHRYVFPRGSRVLFFLDRQDGSWQPAGGPFSRWAEDVLTDDAPWLQLVRFYAEIAGLPADERARALVARRAEWGAQDGPVAQLLAADVDRQLAGPNEPLRGELPALPADEAAADPANEENTTGTIESMADEAMEAAEAARAAAEGAGEAEPPRTGR